jgi:hypothetical protein
MQAHAEGHPEVHPRGVLSHDPTTDDSGADGNGGKVTIQDLNHPADAGRTDNILLLPSTQARNESEPHVSRPRNQVLEMD